MKLFRKNNTKEVETGLTRTEALACIPNHPSYIIWEHLEDGIIQLEYPLNIKPFFIQLSKKFFKQKDQKMTKKLQLDEMGSKVWAMVDGKKDVKSIIKMVEKESDFSLVEAEVSVTTFFKELGRRGLIHLQ